MSNPFEHLRSVSESLRNETAKSRLAQETAQQKKQAQLDAISPMVTGVLTQLRNSAFPRWELVGWHIGYTGVRNRERHFQAVVSVGAVWSSEDTLTGLVAALLLPNDETLKGYGAEHGLKFEGTGMQMRAQVKASLDEDSLVAALQKLLPERFLKDVTALMVMDKRWKLQS